ncbi:PREDICTED: 39S ribosomal protein L35, mitochondrial [Dinoponera quadriceps]|uniref:Large ribosomal subunit protein bL35m n=1 Tax=Dinoponera quadriceps TaxID=609295 RepID=A0A6P3X0T9_DINQU|nr:PREDICTED: 39S ribosomal protein L35, mitochondrial [Dinoponera quadriceps]
MLRVLSAALRGVAARTVSTITVNPAVPAYNCIASYTQYRAFGALSSIAQRWAAIGPVQQKTLLSRATENLPPVPVEPINIQVRTVVRFSLSRGKRQTVKTVLKRFYRLNWGIWIRTKSGRHKHLWKKSAARRKRLRQHVFCNATQCKLLDKMVNKYWKRPRYYVDDPYTPYHSREEFPFTRRKPLPLP